MTPAHQRELGRIEAMLTTAVEQLQAAQTELMRLGHDDSSDEINAIIRQTRRLVATTRDRLA